MNNLKKLAIVIVLTLTASSFSTASEAAYRCAWRYGHRVCWYVNTNVYHYYPRAESRSYVVYTTDRPYKRCFWVNGKRFCRY